MSKDPQTMTLIEVSDMLKKRYVEQSQKCQLNYLLRALALISKTDVNYKSAKNQRLLVEMTLMQLTFLTASADAEKKNDSLESPFDKKSETETVITPSVTKVTSLQEPEIKLATKPSVPFDQLKIKSAFSLHETKAQNNKTLEAILTSAEEAAPKEANKEVSLEDVKTVIKDYAVTKQKNGQKQVGITLEMAQISFDNKIITLKINNESQKEKLTDIKQEFLDEIRKLLQNNLIGLEIEITAGEAQGKAYKPIDVFKNMAEKNPALLELKKTFRFRNRLLNLYLQNNNVSMINNKFRFFLVAISIAAFSFGQTTTKPKKAFRKTKRTINSCSRY